MQNFYFEQDMSTADSGRAQATAHFQSLYNAKTFTYKHAEAYYVET